MPIEKIYKSRMRAVSLLMAAYKRKLPKRSNENYTGVHAQSAMFCTH